MSEAKKRGPWRRQWPLRGKMGREKIQVIRITKEHFRRVNIYYSRLSGLQFWRTRKFPCCTLPPLVTPKPLVKLVMHLRKLEFSLQCEGEWVAYLSRVKTVEENDVPELSENQGPGSGRRSGCSVVSSRGDMLPSPSLYCSPSMHDRPINWEISCWSKE